MIYFVKILKLLLLFIVGFYLGFILRDTKNYIFSSNRGNKTLKELPCRLTIIFSMLVTIIYLI